MPNKNINQMTFLKYSEIYDNLFDGNLDNLFAGISEELALGIMHHLNHYENLYRTKDGTVKFLRENWFSGENIEHFVMFKDKLNERAANQEENQIIIFNIPANLTFFEALVKYLIAHPENEENRPSNGEMEILLIKAYLIINERIINENSGLVEINENFPKEEPFWLFLHSSFRFADLSNRNLLELWRVETVKAILLFEHLEKSVDTKMIMNAFLEKFDCVTWVDYVKSSAGMAVACLDTQHHKGNYFIDVDTELPMFSSIMKIIDSIQLEIADAILPEDFIFLRNHPIYRTGETKFQVLYKRFFIEKIFRALYFQLRQVNLDLKVMSDKQFRDIIFTGGYSENVLLYTMLDQIFEDAEKKIHGKIMEELAPQFGATDYLSYSHGNIFLFESKDVLIKRKVKEEMYIPVVRAELWGKFYKDGNNAKAVLQLAKNIKKIMDGSYARFGFNPVKYNFVYPIIIVHSDAFNAMGLHHILNLWFLKACEEAGITKKQRYKIKPVILLDINTLTFYHEQLTRRKTKLSTIIDTFQNHVKLRTNVQGKWIVHSMEQMIPFANFLQQEIMRTYTVSTSTWIINKISQIFGVHRRNQQ